MTEQHKAFSASTVFFQAALSSSARRTASVGPGLPGHAHDEVHHPGEHSSSPAPLHVPHPNGLPSPTFYTRSASMDPRQLSSSNRRSFSDNTGLQRDSHALHHQDAVHLHPTPPYSPPLNSSSSITDHRSPSHSHSGSISQSSGHPKPEDSPAQTLEDLRRALMNNMEAGQPSMSSYNCFLIAHVYAPCRFRPSWLIPCVHRRFLCVKHTLTPRYVPLPSTKH